MTRRPAERVGKGSSGRRRSGAERASGLIVQDPPDALQVLGGPAPPVPLTFGPNDSSWGRSTSDVRVTMQLASMGWTSNLVRVGTGGEGDTTRVVAQQSLPPRSGSPR